VDEKKIWDALGVGPGVFFVTSIDVQQWSNQVIVSCVYASPEISAKEFKLVFTDCTDFRWVMLGDDVDFADPEVDRIDFELKEDRLVVINTGVFGLTTTYGSMTIQKQW
jgi:hypothetical protein